MIGMPAASAFCAISNETRPLTSEDARAAGARRRGARGRPACRPRCADRRLRATPAGCRRVEEAGGVQPARRPKDALLPRSGARAGQRAPRGDGDASEATRGNRSQTATTLFLPQTPQLALTEKWRGAPPRADARTDRRLAPARHRARCARGRPSSSSAGPQGAQLVARAEQPFAEEEARPSSSSWPGVRMMTASRSVACAPSWP